MIRIQKRAASVADGEAEAADLGATLREARLAQGRELRDLAQTLRIRAVYLEAIECGRFKDLPGQAYASGFLRTYAAYLGLDPEAIVNRYRASAAGAEHPTNLVLPSPAESGNMPTASVLLLAAAIGILAYGAWYYMSVQGRDPIAVLSGVPSQIAGWFTGERTVSAADVTTASDGTPPRPSAERVDAPPAARPETPPVALAARGANDLAPAEPGPSPRGDDQPVLSAQPANPERNSPIALASEAETAAVPLAASGAERGGATDGQRRRIVVRATADSWVEIRPVGEAPIFSRVLRRGESYDVPERFGLMLTTGNAAGIEIVVDGATLTALGPQGAVVRNIALDADRLRSGAAAAR